jgi:hypothetical protein
LLAGKRIERDADEELEFYAIHPRRLPFIGIIRRCSVNYSDLARVRIF